MLTFIGLVTIIITAVNFFNINKLFYTLVFFMPFSASTIFILQGSKAGMQPAYFIGLIFIFRTLIKYSKSIKINQYYKDVTILIFTLVVISTISLLNPLLLDYFGVNYIVFNVIDTSNSTIGSLSQFAYFLFFIILLYTVLLFLDSFDKVKQALYVFLLSSTFTVLWAILIHEGSYIFGFEYPAYIFNNHPGYAQGYTQEIYGYINRICSVAQEPSIYGYLLSISISILLFSNYNNIYFFRKNVQILILFLHIFTIFLTTSSTAFIGLALVVSIYLIYEFTKMNFPKINKKLFYSIFFMVSILLTLFLLFNYLVSMYFNFDLLDLISLLTVNKLDDGSSGDERFGLFLLGINTFMDTYMLGAGFGLNRTVDINSTLLANIGLLGFFSWILLCLYPFFAIKKLYKYCSFEQRQLVLIILFSNVVSYILMSLSIPDFINLYFWLFFGLLISIPNIILKEKSLKELE